MLKLIFEDEDTELLSFWKQQFTDFPEATFKQIYPRQKVSYSQTIDAQLQQWYLPCNEYGIYIERGESLVIDVRKYKELTPWIVTTPRLDIPNLSQSERDYLIFKLSFEAITEHNEFKKKTPIETLSINIEMLYCFRNHIPYDEAKGACKAYKDYKEKQT
ncbi:hypothetical protein H1P_650007 [Hyella patelloides LEGE 07179]|uniref:Uncharacterized protein n=1 Tax=Hyella patelloides LEGE 07179 TaxID=945734 RepID=A0A563W2D4_9CYAN|nr:hypothetical protein [Hyella patelloides]VEP17841.1 hypothetical protein H1P_650007 [Hyella patelloides LEGE 07179]